MALERPATAQATRLGKYELIKELAGSGVASSWIAKTSDDGGRLLSVMRVHRHVIKKTEHIEAFLDDARRAQSLRHPSVLPFVDVGVTDGEVFVVLEHVEGELLSTLITQAGAAGLAQPIALRIARDAFEGLAAGHAAGVFHGEFAPHHVRVGIDGGTKVAGFGVATALARMGPHGIKNHDRLAYAAPERVKSMAAPLAGSQSAADEKSDVFSAGVVLWELLAKQRLFSSKIEAAVIQKVLTAPVPMLASVAGANVPESLDQAVQRALTRDASQRLGSVQELVDAIDASGADFASQEEVAQLVERLAGKTIAARKLDLIEATAAAKANGPSSAVKVASRKATLMGFAPPSEPPPPPSTTAGDETKKDVKVAAPRAPMISTLDDEWVNTVDTGDTEVSGDQAKIAAAAVAGKPMPPPRRPAATMLGIPPLGGDAPPLDLDTTIDDDKPPVAPPPPTIEPFQEEEPRPSTRKPPPPPPKRSGALMLGSLGSLGISTAPSVPKEKDKEKSESPKPSPIAAKKETKSTAPGPIATETVRPARAALEAKAATPTPASTAVDDKPSETPQTTDPGKRRGPMASALDKVQPGSTLGRYEILMPLARGGMASVWAGRMQGSRGFSKIVAIKTMLPDISDDPDFQTMFLDEARVAARIKHPNVAQILDLGEESDVLYLVMDWVEGETLGHLQRAAKQHGGVPLPIALRIASQALSGLHAAHELRDDSGNLIDLVHRDVSPGNVLVSMHGFVKIVDFGIAKSKGRLHVTRAGGLVKGKTPYLSPEQLGQLPIDRRSDIFSFGCLLYVMTTGLHPFRGENEVRTVENIALKAPTPPRELNPAIPVELDRVILRALEKDPAKRFASAAELSKAIAQIAATLEPTSDEDVAEFVRKVVGDVQAKRAQELKAAIASLEEASAKPAKVAEATPEPIAADKRSETSGVTADDIAPVEIDNEKGALAEAAEADSPKERSADRKKPLSTAPAAIAGGSDEDSIHIPQNRASNRTKYVVGGVLGVCALIGLIALVSRGGDSSKAAARDAATATAVATAAAPPPEPAAATAPPAETPAATATAAPSEAASAAPAPSAEASSEAAPSATAEAKPKPTRPSAKNTAPPVSKPAAPAAKPKPAPAAKPTKKYNPTGI